MTISSLVEKLNLKILVEGDDDREVTGGYCGDLLSWVMGRAKADDAWITIMSNVNILAVASLADTACIVLAEGVTVDEGIKATAAEKCINIISTDFSIFEAAVSINDML